ncbi:MAG: protein kinase domain-containing protein [Acidobacteriota bacterium]
MKSCPKCGATYPDEYNICPQDGAPLASDKPSTVARVVDGKYQIVRLVGRGGMGAVYEAIHTTMQRRVALKILNADLVSNPAALERFRREALLSGRLKHPNAITIYDYGMSAIGEAYIVMEFLEGHSLGQELQQAKTLSPLRVVSVLAPVCDAVQAAHAEGIIHRDLKPANIMLEKLRTGETVKVLDFGIAKLAMNNPNLMNLTGTGIIGTPQYMSPEQCQAHRIDGRSDVYSIGIIAYEMLTGKLPFDEPTPLATVIAQVKQKPKPLRELRPEIPPALEAVVMRALEKSPANRYQTAEELAEAFRTMQRQLMPGSVSIVTPQGIPALPPEPSPAAPGLFTRVVPAEAPPLLKASTLSPSSIHLPTGMNGGEFVGRTPELGVLIAAWQSVTTRRGRPVIIFGEAGIGKTRLIEQFMIRLEDVGEGQPILLRMRCDPARAAAGQLPLSDIRMAAMTYFNPELRAVRSLSPADEQFLDGTFFANLCDELYATKLAARLAADQNSFFADLTYLCRLLSQERGAILFLDDAHYADSLLLEFVSYLLRQMRQERLLTVVASRPLTSLPDGTPALRNWLQGLDDVGGYDQIKLLSLSNSEIRLMVEGLLGAQVRLPFSVALMLAEETKGNPYYVCEVVSALIANGQISHGEETGWVCQDVDEFDLPEAIVALVKPLLARLDDDLADVLAHAAVMGEEFTFDLLQFLTESTEEDLLQHIERALKLGLIREMAGWREDRYSFVNTMVHRVLYRRITRRRRKRLHARIAEWLEQQTASPRASAAALGRQDFTSGDLAYHYFRAEEWRKAIEYALEAGYARWNLYAFADAGKFFGWVAHALQRLQGEAAQPPLSPDEEARYWLTYGTLLIECAQPDDARQALERALELCQAHELTWLGRTQVSLARLCDLTGDAEGALHLTAAALPTLRARDDATGLCQALLVTATAHIERGRLTPALQSVDEALYIAERSGDRSGQAAARLVNATINVQRGKFAGALADARQALTMARHLGNVFEEWRALALLGAIHLQLVHLDEAQECYAGSLRIAYVLGHRYGESVALNGLGEVFLRRGNDTEAMEYIQQAVDIARDIGNGAAEARYLLNVGRIRRRRSDAKSALSTFQAALLLAETAEVTLVEAEILVEIGDIQRAAGDFAAAETCYARARELALEVESLHVRWVAAYGLAECFMQRQDYANAQVAIEEALSVITTLQTDLPDDTVASAFLEDKRPVFDLKVRLDRALATRPLEAKTTAGLKADPASSSKATALADETVSAVAAPASAKDEEVKASSSAPEADHLKRMIAVPPPPAPLPAAKPPAAAESVAAEMPSDLDALHHLTPGCHTGRRSEASEFSLEELLNDVAAFAENLGMGELFNSGRLAEAIIEDQSQVPAAPRREARPTQPHSFQSVLHSVVSLESTWREMLQTARATGDRDIERKGLMLMASALHSQGQVARARDCYQRAVQIMREINDRTSEGAMLKNIGDTFRQEGRYADALAYYRLAIRSARENKNQRVLEMALVDAGQMYTRTGNLREALHMLKEAQEINRTTDDAQVRAEMLQTLGEVHLIRKELTLALDCSVSAAVTARELGDRDVEWRAQWVIARCRWARGDRTEALAASTLTLQALESLLEESNPHDQKRLSRERSDIAAVVEEWRRITDDFR